MRLVPVLLLCLSAVACSRTDPDSAPAPAPAVAADEALPAEVAATDTQPPAVELTASEAAAATTMSPACNLENVDGTVVVDMNPIEAKSRQVLVGGWAFDEVNKNVPAELFVRVYSTSGDGRIWQYQVTQDIERGDVQATQGRARVLKSGFRGSLDLASLDPGKYLLRLSFLRDGAVVLCDNGRSVVLK